MGCNVLLFSLHSPIRTASMLKDVYVVVAAVRHMCGPLQSRMHTLAQAKLVFVPADRVPSLDERAPLWSSLGVNIQWVADVAYQLCVSLDW